MGELDDLEAVEKEMLREANACDEAWGGPDDKPDAPTGEMREWAARIRAARLALESERSEMRGTIESWKRRAQS